MRRIVVGIAVGAMTLSGVLAAGPATARTVATAPAETEYVVLTDPGAQSAAAATAAVQRAGGTVTSTDADIGFLVARSRSSAFETAVDASPAVTGTARNQVIGAAPKERRAPRSQIERLRDQVRGAGRQRPVPTAPAAEPLAGLQWDMRQIDATPTGSYRVEQGSKKVLVGVIDTGVDGTHPDIAPNFSASLSRNFVTDMPDIDGPCEHPSCVDPANEDDDGHGTHVASTIGSPINGLGVAGVAPNVTLVNIRAGQDSGYFFLKSTLEALVYAGRIGVDVVNMSFYTDPWLFNCTDNAADSPAEQREQRVIRIATQRALDFARNRGVLPVAALGNESTDLNDPTEDDTSPDYPDGAAKDRAIDDSCITVPTESRGVVSVAATGSSTRKAFYSNYGTEQTDVSAPGGDTYDTADGQRDVRGAVLAAYPESLARANGDLNDDGTSRNEAVVRSCTGSVCGYYQYLQGTSMASPHAAGVAALIVSRYGSRTSDGLGLDPALTERRLLGSATEHACPTPRAYHYVLHLPDGTTDESDARCEGPKADNGFYGRGIVNALAAVTGRG